LISSYDKDIDLSKYAMMLPIKTGGIGRQAEQ
jgi:hypothetical protein